MDAKKPLTFPRLVPTVQDLCLAAQQHTTSGLFEEETDGEDDKAAIYRLDIENPAPFQMLSNQTRAQGSQSSTKDCSSSEERHGSTPILMVIDVTDDTSHHGRKGATANASEKSGYQHTPIRACKPTAKLADNEKYARGYEHRPSPIDLRKRRQNHWSDSETGGESGDANENSDISDTKISRHLDTRWTIRAGSIGRDHSDEAREPCSESLTRFRPGEGRIVGFQVRSLWD